MTMTAMPVAPSGLRLRDYQVAALEAIDEAEQRGVRRQLIVLPTGTGKTIVFSHLRRQRGGRALILAHREELIRQAVVKLWTVDPSISVGVVKADEDQVGAQTIVASVQTLAVPARLARLGCDFETVIVDEAHHSSAPTYRRVLESVGAFESDGPLLVGFTATPERGDRVGLDSVFEEIVFQRGMLAMVAAGYLSDLRAVQIRLRDDFEGLHVRAGDYVDREIEEVLLAADAPELVVAAYQEHAAGRKTIAFTPTVALAELLARLFRDAGVAATALSASTPAAERREALAAFGRGDCRVVVNCGILIEGFDEPSVECVIVARPTRSRPLYQQMIGRGTRLFPGKEDCLVIDLVGATTSHDLVTTASLFGLPPRDLVGRTVVAAVGRAQALDPHGPIDLGDLEAAPVDLFQRRKMQWVQSGRCWSLSLGDGMLILEPQADGWSVFEHRRECQVKALVQGLPLPYAQGVAEDRARSLGAEQLLDPAAPWRQRPASEKQLALLRRRRVRVPDGLTSGQASDLITASFARRLA